MEAKKCPSCGGCGELATSHRFTCYSCDGAGTISDPEKYRKAVEGEKEYHRNLERNSSAEEYRQMGG